MPTFCRHNRFIERCPICSKTLPGHAPPAARPARGKAGSATRTRGTAEGARRRQPRPEGLRVVRETRADDDGYRSELVPGIHATLDADRLAREIAFASGRLLALAADPPGLYARVRELAGEDLQQAAWTCFLIVYLSPLEGEDPFAGVRLALEGGETPDLNGVPLGPRTSHDPARGSETLAAYRNWVERAGGLRPGADGAPATLPAFGGDPSWAPERRFERVLERLTLPGFGRSGRYDLLVTLGRLGVFDMRAGSLALAGAATAGDPTVLAAKRVFGIGDPLLLERRASALAEAAAVPIEALDLGLANWAAAERATLGVPPDSSDDGALERAAGALGL